MTNPGLNTFRNFSSNPTPACLTGPLRRNTSTQTVWDTFSHGIHLNPPFLEITATFTGSATVISCSSNSVYLR